MGNSSCGLLAMVFKEQMENKIVLQFPGSYYLIYP